MHKEDIKAGLRKRFKSLTAFETESDLPEGTVRDILRGRRSARTEQAIAEALSIPVHRVFPARYPAPLGGESSTKRDDSTLERPVHRLSGAGR